MKKTILFAAVLLSINSAYAITASGKVTYLGCSNTADETCYVTFDGQSSIPTCNKSNQVRWQANTSQGKRWFAIFLAAKLSGNRINDLNVDPTVCSIQGYPTFTFGGF